VSSKHFIGRANEANEKSKQSGRAKKEKEKEKEKESKEKDKTEPKDDDSDEKDKEKKGGFSSKLKAFTSKDGSKKKDEEGSVNQSTENKRPSEAKPGMTKSPSSPSIPSIVSSPSPKADTSPIPSPSVKVEAPKEDPPIEKTEKKEYAFGRQHATSTPKKLPPVPPKVPLKKPSESSATVTEVAPVTGDALLSPKSEQKPQSDAKPPSLLGNAHTSDEVVPVIGIDDFGAEFTAYNPEIDSQFQ